MKDESRVENDMEKAGEAGMLEGLVKQGRC